MTLQERIESKKMISAVNVLKVIDRPIRLAIVDLLSDIDPMTVLDIQNALNLEQAVASQHLNLMEDKGVLLSEKIRRN